MAKFLSEMKPPKGAVKSKKRLGRGDASGRGGTAGRGHKGQKARSGGYHKVGFEGGQMPLARRLPKRGFNNKFKKLYCIINLKDLVGIEDGTRIDLAFLKKNKIVKQSQDLLKVLGVGELDSPLTIIADKFSKTAEEKIKKAGGQIEYAKSA
ncbi:MAG: 50S ribosomal protein L15 [Deltaproteobacteria bacterium]|nr:50S ribosomal protein L15 [Deltaproteobacteria bacterium]